MLFRDVGEILKVYATALEYWCHLICLCTRSFKGTEMILKHEVGSKVVNPTLQININTSKDNMSS